MDVFGFAYFPFVNGAVKYVESLDFKLEELFSERAFEQVRERGKERVLEAVNGIYLFSWDEIADDSKLIDFLIHHYRVRWVKHAKIKRENDGATINVYYQKNSISLQLNDKKNKLNLTFDDGDTYEFVVRLEKNGLNVYNIGITKHKALNEVNAKNELLSYPIARILVSCINDSYLIHRYAHAEAESANNVIRKINVFLKEYDDIDDILKELADDFNINASIDEESVAIHFTDYIRYATIFHDTKWKLINSNMKCGMVYLPKEKFSRIIQEAVRKRIESSLPVDVPPEICASLENYLVEIRNALVTRKSEFSIEEFKEIMPDCFPPCMVHALSNAQAGVNLPHSMRFALTSYLLNIGMNVEGIIELFKISPDFDEERTRYQVMHIHGATGTTYTSPSCATMITYGNCFGKEALCERISHPLSYYRRKAWILKKGKPADNRATPELPQV